MHSEAGELLLLGVSGMLPKHQRRRGGGRGGGMSLQGLWKMWEAPAQCPDNKRDY